MNEYKKILVYVDDIEKWQICEVFKITSHFTEEEAKKNKIYGRAKIITKNGTMLDRLYKIVDKENDITKDGCVYFIKN